MRLIVNGQQAFCQSTIEAILEKGEDEIVCVLCAPDKEGGPVDPVKELAREKGLTLYQPPNYSDAEVLDYLRSLDADLMVMAYMIIFVPEEARNIPKHGSICFHPSKLPAYRGPSSINWPIIGGETSTGLTIFYPDDGLDEGDILLQKDFEIGPDDTLGDMYFGKIFKAGVEGMLEAIDLVRAGNPPRAPQDASLATYESWCRKKQARIDWNQPYRVVYNLIRGCNPQPGAWTTVNGERLAIFDARAEAGNFGSRRGEVFEIGKDYFKVGAMGGCVKVMRVKPDGDKKLHANDYIAKYGLEKGAILGG